MKRLLTILLVFAAFITKAQVSYSGYPTQATIQKGGAGALVTFIIPQDTDINAFPTLPKNGRIAVKNGKFYNYDSTQGKWVKPASSGSGTTYYPGYAIKIEGDSIKTDTSVLSGYFVRDKDSTIQFVTPTQLATGLATKANVSHTHTIADITNLQTVLNGKLDSLTVSNDSFYTWKNGVRSFLYYNDHYTKAQTNSLLAGKSDIGHTHTISNITGLSDSLSKKADTAVTNTLTGWVHAKAKVWDTLNIFNNSFNTGSVGTGFTDLSNNSSYAGGKLTWTADQNNYINYIQYNNAVLSESYYQTLDFTFDGNADHARGLAIGTKSVNQFGYIHTVIAGYDADSGKSYFRNNSTKFYGAAVNTNMQVGDHMRYVLLVKKLHYTIIIYNITRAWSISYTQELSPSGVPFSAANAGYPALYHVGGDFSVTNWTFNVIKPVNADLLVDGNSIWEGQAATAEGYRAADILPFQDRIIICGGGADGSWEALQTTGFQIMLYPKMVLMFQGNDKRLGRSDSASHANMLAKRDSLVAKGIAVGWLYPVPDNYYDMTPLVHWLDTCTHIAGDLKIEESYYSFLDSSNGHIKAAYDAGDGTHLNNTGQAKLAYVTATGLQAHERTQGAPGYVSVFNSYRFLSRTDLFYDFSNGRFGFGTAAPAEKVHIVGNLKVQGNGYFTSYVFSENSFQTWGSFFALPPNNTSQILSGGYGNPFGAFGLFIKLDADGHFGLGPKAGVGSGRTGSQIGIDGNATIGTSYYNTTVCNNCLAVEGKVGIGTSSPAEGLHVVGNAIVTGDLTLTPANDATPDSLLTLVGGKVKVTDAAKFKSASDSTAKTGYAPVYRLDTLAAHIWQYATGLVVGGGASWGAITGTLSSQTDLQNALDAKKDKNDSTGVYGYVPQYQLDTTRSDIWTALNGKQATLSGTGLVKSTSGTISYIPDNSSNWNTAYGWGNHASAGYALQSTTVNGHALSSNVTVTTGDLGATTVGNNLFTLPNPTAIRFMKINADNTVSTEDAATFRTSIGAGTGNGSVTSVALTLPSWLSVSGSPVTSSGTLAVSAATGQTQNQFLATPNGSTGAVGLRSIVAADIPTLNQNTTGSAATLTTPRAIYGNNFDGSAALTQIIASTYGGTGNGFTKFSGPATSEKTFTLPNASATILTDNAVVTGAQGGTGVNNSGKTITLANNLVTSGNFSLTLTATGVTNVTLPTTGTLATLAGSETFTNKTLTSPVISSITNTGTLTLPTVTGTIMQMAESSITSSATPTPTGDAKMNFFDVTALATAPTFAAPSGTPANHNSLMVRIKDNSTARALSWNAIYRAGTDFALPTTTVIGKTMYVQFIYNSADSKWDCVGSSNGY